MKTKSVYIIAGCNGAGKTTASFTILPEILKCKEFVNADQIAAGISPFQPDKVAFEAGRIMLERIDTLLKLDENFAFETTLSTKSYKNKLIAAKEKGYEVKLLFFWLPSIEMAIKRVKLRVSEGGHNIPKDIIARRYKRGIENLFKIYLPLCDSFLILDNEEETKIIAKGNSLNQLEIIDNVKWNLINNCNE